MRIENINKESVTQAILKKIKKEQRGSEIHARHTKEFTNPARFAWKNKEQNYMPDIIVRHNNEGLNIYEIELSNEFDIQKWRLYSLYARKSRGRLHIVMPKWLHSSAEETIKENNLRNVNLEYIIE